MNDIEITFQLHTTLQMHTQEGRVTSLRCRIQAGHSIDDALRAMGLPINPDETLVVVNHQNVGLDYRPKAGDVIHLIPAIAGG